MPRDLYDSEEVQKDNSEELLKEIFAETQKQVEEQNYTIVQNLLDPTTCQSLYQRFELLIKQGKTEKDDQCPLSHAVYAAYDDILEQLCSTMEDIVGKDLYPTYSYARMYTKGEVLELHKDRPACEYSATLLLGYKDCNWEIGFQNDDEDTKWYTLNVGDAAIYKGCDVAHLRDQYKGTELIQVFLHYVDANGEYASEKYDGRETLGVLKNTPNINVHEIEQVEQEEVIPCWHFEKAITDFECDLLIDKFDAKRQYTIPGQVGAGSEGVVDERIRNVNRLMLPTYQGIGAQLVGAAMSANAQAWQFIVTHADQCEHLYYDVNGHYVKHVDAFIGRPVVNCRKLTALAFLNDDFEGGEFFLQEGHQKFYPRQNKGDIVVFPSFMMHGVEPVTKGFRHSIVCWILGPSFR